MRKHILRLFYALCRHLPIDRNKVLFFSYYGEHYSGSPKYISQYISANSDLQPIWAFVQPEKHPQYEGRVVKYGHLCYYYHLATAGTIITNYRTTTDFEKRKGQIYIQTWHSSLRTKHIEKDAEATLPANYIAMAKHDSPQVDYLLTGSDFGQKIFERAFWYSGKIAKIGTPQCDILFEDRTPYKNKVCKHFKLFEDTNIAMYAPTFRKGHDTSVYDIDPEEVVECLQKRFGGNWVLLMRLHPHLINKADCFHYTDTVIPATSYDDVQELLAVCDFLISDYSAIMFDYSVTHRPCVLFTPDLEEYTRSDRKLYFDINQLPFPNFADKKSLKEGITGFDEQKYAEDLNSFLSSIGSVEDGKASRKVLEIIKQGQK